MDSIKLFYEQEELSQYPFEDLLNQLPAIRTNQYKLENFTVFSDGQIMKLVGSVASLVFPYNVLTPNASQIQTAFEKLSNDYHFPFRLGKVTRLDYAATFQVSQKPRNYFDLLLHYPRAFQSYHPNKRSLNFTNSQKKIIFYDKRGQTQSSKPEMLVYLPSGNLLRYENSFYNNPGKVLGLSPFYLYRLYDDDVINHIKDAWRKNYRKIIKFNPIMSGLPITGKKMDFFRQGMAIAIEKGCFGTMGDMIANIELHRKNGIITSKQKRDLILEINYLSTLSNRLNTAPDLIKELDELIENH